MSEQRKESLQNNPNLSKKDVKIVEKILSKNDIKAAEMKERYLKEAAVCVKLHEFSWQR